MNKLVRFFRPKKKEEGAAIVEYGLLIALIALACILALTTLGTNLSNMFNGMANTIKSQPTNGR